jgi:hypothetical protein
MNGSLKGNSKPLTPEQIQLRELMQKLRAAWLEQRMRRIEVIQGLHC